MQISIVIATKDRARYLERALASFEGQAGAPEFEVVVVDNGSGDDTAAVAQRQNARARFPVAYLYEAEPNRGKARNRGIAVARGKLIVFCDDDVRAPARWLRAHAAAHAGGAPTVANGPILNVASYDAAPRPSLANYSRAFLCTCNASVPRALLVEVGGFDEGFDLYGWEDTELGVRLRAAGAGWKFAWTAAIWHIKPPDENTLEVETRKAVEKARMARRFVEKHPSKRARMATGVHALNAVRARYLLPDALLAMYAGVATGQRVPGWIKRAARTQFLDGMYARELARAPAPPET
ncbi:MAG TPA: glycosyltransferase [Candidatus Tumulicola sp.]